MVRRARRNLRGRRAAIVRGSGLALPFRDGVFDAVVLTFPAPYVRRAGPEIRRVLTPGGRLVIADAGCPGAFGLGARLLVWAASRPEAIRMGYEADLRRAGFRLTTQAVPVDGSAVLVMVGEVEAEKATGSPEGHPPA
jgi:SAM-dependent methyltransferase